jgi:hypothetical protein
VAWPDSGVMSFPGMTRFNRYLMVSAKLDICERWEL